MKLPLGSFLYGFYLHINQLSDFQRAFFLLRFIRYNLELKTIDGATQLKKFYRSGAETTKSFTSGC